MMKTNKDMAMAFAIVGVSFVIVAGTVLAQQSTYAAEPIKAQLRALQDGNAIDADAGVDGIPNLDVDCVGGINPVSNADSTKCYLLSDESIWAVEYSTDPSVVVEDGSAVACPAEGDFAGGVNCFSATFDASNFAGQGDHRFVAEFYDGDTLVGIARQDYRLHSFFVLPESAIGAVALVGSSLAAFAGYTILSKRNAVANVQ